MRLKALIKAAAMLVICCYTATACTMVENPHSSDASESSVTDSDVSVSSEDSTNDPSDISIPDTVTDSSSEPVVPDPVFPTEDIPETVTGIHDLSTGNFIYNPNVTDTSFEERYYADFKWVKDNKVLWRNDFGEQPWGKYDWDGAVEFGQAHWADGVGLCAEFISRCLTSVDFTYYTTSSTSISLQLMHSGLGFGQFVPYNKSDHTITLPEYARPGDVIQIYCSFEGTMIHSLLMVGTDDEGKLRVVCHNLRNGGFDTFHVDYLNDPCYDCESETVEVFFYHFYRDDDVGLPEEVQNDKSIVLWEENAYVIPDQTYDREAALGYARTCWDDGLGYYGANHTSEILQKGGLLIGYPNQSALFFQILKSHLGTAESLHIRDDRTVLLPSYAKAGDLGFIYCPYDGLIYSSFIISGIDETGRMITLSYDLLNNGESAFKVDSYCMGCGDELKEMILYHFDD